MRNYLVLYFALISIVISGVSHAASGVSSGKIKTIVWYEGHTGVLVVQDNMSDLRDAVDPTTIFLMTSTHTSRRYTH